MAATKKKKCKCKKRGLEMAEFIYYHVKGKKAMMDATHCAQSSAKKGVRSYIQRANKGDLMITTSDFSKAKPFIKKYGIGKVSLMGGNPIPPPTCSTGNPNCGG